MTIDQTNLIYVLIGCMLFSVTATVLASLLLMDIKERRRIQEHAFQEHAQRRLARSSNALRKGHRR